MSGRSPHEREAARREREIRRLERAGEPIPPELLQPVEPPPPAPEPVRPPAAPEPQPEPPAPVHEPAPPAPLPEPAPLPPEPEPRAPTVDEPTQVRRPEPAPSPEPAPVPPPVISVAHGDQDTGDHPPYDDDQHSGEWHFDTGEHDAPPPGTPIAPRFGATGTPPRVPGGRARRRKWPIVLGVAAVLFVAIVGYAVAQVFQPFGDAGTGTCTVKIAEGSSTSDIADALVKSKVIDSAFFFQVRAKLDGSNLRPGTYELGCDAKYADVIKALSAVPVGPKHAAVTVDVAIPEGLSRREIAPITKKAGLIGDYVAATKRSRLLNPRRWGAPKGTPTLEGFLFPATYPVKPKSSVSKLVAQQLTTFKERIATVDLAYAKKKNLTVYDVLVIASMVDRETAVAGDRAKVAAVIYNRLKAKIPLGIDATTRYEFNDWTRPITQSQLESPSAYNTRKNLGLPPTPIGNPGLAAIEAAANPSRKDYLFFVVKPCGDGASAFSSTNAQFQRDEAAYNAARAQNGGNDPSHCKKKP